jgi:hypothetical protein
MIDDATKPGILRNAERRLRSAAIAYASAAIYAQVPDPERVEELESVLRATALEYAEVEKSLRP